MKKLVTIFLLCSLILSIYSPANAANTPNETQFIQQSKKYIGVRYVYGGNTPSSGFDCTGYINYVYNKFGYSLPRTSANIYASKSLSPVKELKVGDLVFFETYKPGASHAGIYIGSNQFVHASSSKGVTVSNMGESYWNTRYLGARRHEQLSSNLSFSTDDEAKKLWFKAYQHYQSASVSTQSQEVLQMYNSLRKHVGLNDGTALGQYIARTAHLIDSVNVASSLSASTKQLRESMINNQELSSQTVAQYHQHSANINKSERVFSRLYGSELRGRYNQEAITPAKIARETVIYEVSMYGLLDIIESKIEQGSISEAQSLLEKYNRLEKRAVDIKNAGNAIHINAYQSLDQMNQKLQERKKAAEAAIQNSK